MSQQLWLVQRRGFNRELIGTLDVPEMIPRVPLCVFSDPDQAEAYRKELEQFAQNAINPFLLADLPQLTSLSERQLLARMPFVGKPRGYEQTPWSDQRDWAAWWRDNVGNMRDEDIERVWAAFDRLQLYEVVPIPLDPPPLEPVENSAK